MALIEQIKKLREDTGLSISQCKKALEETNGDFEKAKENLKKIGIKIAEKKKDRMISQGIIESYIHQNKKIGVLIELNCETDFVARNPDFQTLAHELCLQIAAIDPQEVPLEQQNWIKDPSILIKDLISQYVAKIGERIVIKRFTRYSIQ